MSFSRLIGEAEAVILRVQEHLPPQLRTPAKAVPVIYYDRPSPDILGEEFEPDILGMFVGDSHGADVGTGNGVPAHILLFLENILDQAEQDPTAFCDEVRLTYLHELGHFFGWDEDDLDARGLA